MERERERERERDNGIWRIYREANGGSFVLFVALVWIRWRCGGFVALIANVEFWVRGHCIRAFWSFREVLLLNVQR